MIDESDNHSIQTLFNECFKIYVQGAIFNNNADSGMEFNTEF